MKWFAFILIGIFLITFINAEMPTPIIIDNSELIITKYDGVEAETYLPTTEGNQLCLYHKANTNATSLEELKQLIEEAQDNVPEWDIGIYYNLGDLISYQDQIYKVLQSHTSQSDWTPNNVPALFTIYSFQELGEVPQWTQPTGGHDAYNIKDRVWFEVNGDKLIYESLINANVWSPTAYPAGWKEIGMISETEVFGDETITAINELGSSIIVPRDLDEGLSTYCVNVTKKIQIGTNTIIAEYINDTDYLYETASFEYEGFEINFYCNGEKLEFPTASIISEEEIGIGVKWSLKVPENYSCIGEFTAQQNILEKVNTKESLFLTEQEKYFIDYSDFTNSPLNNISNYEVTEIKDMDLSTWQQFVLFFKKIFGYEPTEEEYWITIAYNKTWTGEFYDFDPSYSFTDITSSNTLQENITSETEFSHITVNDSSLMGYWSFDKNARDLSNNNNDGTFNGDAFVNSSGKYGGALDLDGSGDYVSVADDDSLDVTGNLSISAWVSCGGIATFKGILTKWDGDTSAQQSYWIGADSSGDNIRFYISDGTAVYREGDSDVCDGTWKHVIGVYDGSNITVYVDGSYDGGSLSGSVPASIQSTSTPAYIGHAYDTATHFFNGSIDEVMIFNRALNSTEIQQIYNSTYSRFYSEGNQTFKFQNVTLGTDNRVNITADAETLNGSSLNASLWEADVGANTGYVDNNSGVDLNGLVGYWHGDGNALDYSGNGNDGTFAGNANANAVGVFNNSFSFDGTGDYVDAGSIDLDYLTVSLWINFNDAVSEEDIISERTDGTNVKWQFFRVGTDNDIRFRVDTTGSDTLDTTVSSWATNTWHYLTATYDGTDMKIYINGELDNSKTHGTGGTISATARDLFIGFMAGDDSPVNGEIDEVMIFNRSLSEEEIKSLYVTGSTDHKNNGVGVNWTESSSGEKELTEQNVSILDYSTKCNDGMVSMWVADTTHGFNDVCSRNNGTANGDATIISRTDSPLLNGTYSFDGTGDYVSITNSISFNNEITSCVWIKYSFADADSKTEQIVGKYDSGEGNRVWTLYVDDNEKLNFITSSDGTYQAGNIVTSSNAENDGEWHFICGIHDGNYNYLYVDGSLDTSVDASNGLASKTEQTIIGTTWVSGAYQSGGEFEGQIDEVSIWNRSLSQEEILELYYAGTERHRNTEPFVINTPENSTTHLLVEMLFDSGDSEFYSPTLSNYLIESYNVSEGADTTPPNLDVYNITEDNETAILADFNATDASGISYWWINDTNFKIDQTGQFENNTNLSVGIYSVNISVNDTVGNIASEVIQINITRAIDSTEPIFITIPNNDTITYGDWTGVDFDATDDTLPIIYSVNDSRFTINSTGYLDDDEILAVGIYELIISINDSETPSNQNSTAYKLTINRATSTCTLVDGSVTYPTPVSISGSCTNPETSEELFVDDVLISNPFNQIIGADTYTFKVNVSETQNYTSATDSKIVTVSQGNLIPFLSINNNNSNDWSYTSPVWLKISGNETAIGDGDVTYNLFLDDVSKTNPFTNQFIMDGTYTIKYNTTGGENWTVSSIFKDLILSEGTTGVLCSPPRFGYNYLNNWKQYLC